MTTASAPEATREIALADIQLSNTGSQAERRKHFDKAAIGELAESIKSIGLLSPLIGRQVNGHIELVAGERRYLAAQKAGLKVINVTVRQLTDDQVLEVQLIENLQREGLHELAEAEGYEALQKLGHGAAEIADKVGKSKAYVYARMKLLALVKDSRKAFYEGKLSASTALLLARIPIEALQKQALKEITETNRWGDGPMSVREAGEHIQENYMTRLDTAGFPTEDADLLPAAGACSACPKRTGNQPELFSDIKRGDVCTDPVCFKAKRQAFAERAIAKAKETGQVVITGKAAEKIAPHGVDRLYGGGEYQRLDLRNHDDPKDRTNAQLLGKEYVPTLLQDPETGKLVKVAPAADIKAALKTAGVRPSESRNSYAAEQSREEKKRKLEKKFRATVYEQMRPKLPTELGREDLRTIALRFYQEATNDHEKIILDLWGLEPIKSKNGYGLDHKKPIEDMLARASEADIVKLLFDLVFVKHLQVYNFSSEKPTLLLNTAKKLKINPDKIRAELAAAAKPKKAKAKKK